MYGIYAYIDPQSTTPGRIYGSPMAVPDRSCLEYTRDHTPCLPEQVSNALAMAPKVGKYVEWERTMRRNEAAAVRFARSANARPSESLLNCFWVGLASGQTGRWRFSSVREVPPPPGAASDEVTGQLFKKLAAGDHGWNKDSFFRHGAGVSRHDVPRHDLSGTGIGRPIRPGVVEVGVNVGIDPIEVQRLYFDRLK